MRKKKKDEVNFEINCTKAKWEPKTIEEIPKVVSRAFERELSLSDIKPLVGTDHVKTWPMNEDKDIPVFIKEKSMLNEAFAEKVIRFQLPKDIMPPKWQPKKVKILAKGERLAKYFGEDKVGERNVEVSLKLFECGHFYMKQTLPGSGISPHWTIFEGTWEHTERGLKIEFLIRYSWQVSRKPEFDLSIEAIPWGWSSSLAWSGESESQLNGNIPAIVGTDKWCWVEIYRDADNIPKAQARFNDELDNAPSLKDGTWKDTPGPRHTLKPPKQPKTEGPAGSSETNVGTSASNADKEKPSSSSADKAKATTSSTTSGQASASVKVNSESNNGIQQAKNADEESAWPLYIGLAIFMVVLAYFAWQKLQETVGKWSAWKKEFESGEQW
jgi:hypothetical protein